MDWFRPELGKLLDTMTYAIKMSVEKVVDPEAFDAWFRMEASAGKFQSAWKKKRELLKVKFARSRVGANDEAKTREKRVRNATQRSATIVLTTL